MTTHRVLRNTEGNRNSDLDTMTNYTQQHGTEAQKARIYEGDSFKNIKYIIESPKVKSADGYLKKEFSTF